MKRLLLLLALTVLPAAAQAQGDFGRFHALVIGNEKYQYLTDLKTPKADAEAVAEVLEDQYGFTVKLLVNKSKEEILLALAELRHTMTSAEDNLLIYYAGHGYLDKATGTGYWQPVDAQTDNDVYWIATEEITRLLRAIRTKHVLVVADSCYSGTLLTRASLVRLPKGTERDEWLRRMQAWRSRTALTSGGEEPVLDGGGSGHSIFAKVFLEVLRNNKGILDGDTLFDKIKVPIALYADQTPHYGNIKKADSQVELEQGDFLFVPKELQGVTLQKQPGGKVDLSYLQRGGQKERKIDKYIDHGDGTVTDTETGLMWKRCSEGLEGVNCEKGKAEEYKWDDAVKRFKNVEYAGYKDWRLPTVDELKTLVYCSKGVKDKDDGECNDGSESPTINQQAFPNTEATWFWSGSPSASNSDGGWYVSFYYGSLIYPRYGYSAVRLVRGGQPPNTSPQDTLDTEEKTKTGKYIDHGDGTITDTETGLMWKRCSEGLEGVNCEKGELKTYTWNDAVKRFKNVEYAGYSDWRLPTIDELKTLIYCSKGVKNKDDGECNDGSEKPTINQQAFPNTALWCWSGSPHAYYSDCAWFVLFNYGYSYAGSRDGNNAVRLVRGGQPPNTSPQDTLDTEEKTKTGKYIDHGDGTITDTETGLMWKRCSEGLEGVNCEKGEAKFYKWDDAVKRFKNVEYAGYKDWRLPTVDELKTLIYCSKGVDQKNDWCNDGSEKPTINQQAFPNTYSSYWSGSPPAFSSSSACVYFDLGYSGTSYRGSNYAVRLVRGGQ